MNLLNEGATFGSFRVNSDVSIYTACAPARSPFFLQLVRLQLSSCIAIYAELPTTIALVQSIICRALVDITAFVNITFFALLANMCRRQSYRQSADSSDEYELTDSETEYHLGSETEPTDVDDNVDEVIEDVEGLINCADLLADEVHPPEYYLKQMEEFNESEFTTEDYSDGTTLLLDRIEEQWRQ